MIQLPTLLASAKPPLIQNDAVVFGMLMIILGFVFYTASQTEGFWKRFYAIVPSLLLCYFLPSLLSTAGLISGEKYVVEVLKDGKLVEVAKKSNLYYVASRYLLPTSLVLLTLSIDLKGILRLGPKAVVMFLTGTAGIVIGGPIAILVFAKLNPAVVEGDVWRGMTTVAGSWIGGGANQAAMKEVFNVGDKVFSALIAVDVIVANIWMACLLYAAGRSSRIDKATGADASAIDDLKDRIASYQASILKIPGTADTMVVCAVGFAVTGFSHLCADALSARLSEIAGGNDAHWLNKFSLTSHFFWLIVIATTGGVMLSFTRARQLEGCGASRLGSVFLYVLVATIGMKMDLLAIRDTPWLFAVGLLWISIHAIMLIVMGLLIKAPIFFLAVGSQANVGGAASAPIVASAFHPSLAPVGVLLAVLGYALGTYAAWLCGMMMQYAAS